MTNDQIDELDGPKLSALILTHIFDYTVQTVKPDWYPHEVLCFYPPGSTLMEYSWDKNGCNAIMHANGKDASDGNAKPLPHICEELEEAWHVVEYLKARSWQGMVEVQSLTLYRARFVFSGMAAGERKAFYTVAESPSLAICRAAIKMAQLTSFICRTTSPKEIYE
jgi:hypothetical protein